MHLSKLVLVNERGEQKGADFNLIGSWNVASSKSSHTAGAAIV